MFNLIGQKLLVVSEQLSTVNAARSQIKIWTHFCIVVNNFFFVTQVLVPTPLVFFLCSVKLISALKSHFVGE